MVEHEASVVVRAPVSRVYELFTHFNDYPQFMKHVREVTYLDPQRSHWVVDLFGEHQWEAVSENWIPNRQIAWRSTSGLQNAGRVLFSQESPDRTRVVVRLEYNPPAGAFGDAAETLGVGSALEAQLQADLERFAGEVEQRVAAQHGATTSAERGTIIAQGEELDEELPPTSSNPHERLV
jgi:uncharacterized membrane protein